MCKKYHFVTKTDLTGYFDFLVTKRFKSYLCGQIGSE